MQCQAIFLEATIAVMEEDGINLKMYWIDWENGGRWNALLLNSATDKLATKQIVLGKQVGPE
jgi:hypothetical protein